MAEALRAHGVIPDVISTVPPSVALVTYPYNLQVQIGQELTPTQVKDVPNIQWDADNSCFYTLCLVDPDAPTRTWPKLREVLHWLVVNIPGSDISRGQVLTNYVSSGPPPYSGLHRYVFLVYRQPGRLAFDAERYLSHNTGRPKFSIRNFAQKYNMGEPVAGNMYQCKFDFHVISVYRRAVVGF